MKIKSLIKIFLIPAIFFAVFLVFGNEAKAAEYYVSPSGNDSSSGSASAPFRTIQKAANVVNPGDTVFVRAGTYNERLTITHSGSPDNYITIQNYPGETAILSGSGEGTNYTFMVYGVNISYFKLIGLTFANFKGQCMQFYGDSSHLQIRNNDITNLRTDLAIGGYAIRVAAYIWTGIIHEQHNITDLVIDGNYIHDFYTGPRWAAEVIDIYGNVDRFQLTNNTLNNVQNIGLDVVGQKIVDGIVVNAYPHNGIVSGNNITNWGGPYGENSGLYIDGAHDITIENNYLDNGQSGLIVNVEQTGAITENIIVRRNRVKNSGANYNAGANCYQEIVSDTPTVLLNQGGNANHIRLVHNTGVNTVADKWQYTTGNGIDKIVKNNIFATYINTSIPSPGAGLRMMGYCVSTSNSITLDFNVWFKKPRFEGDDLQVYSYSANAQGYGTSYSSFLAYKTASGQDTHSITVDPLFNNIVTSDFTLQADSPAIDAGDFLTRTTSSGTGTVMPVTDARYFHDGYGISGILGDTIMVGSDTVTVTDVDYNTNTLTVTPSITWSNGDGVSYTYTGSKPDIGAYEYAGTQSDTTPPAAPAGLTVQ